MTTTKINEKKTDLGSTTFAIRCKIEMSLKAMWDVLAEWTITPRAPKESPMKSLKIRGEAERSWRECGLLSIPAKRRVRDRLTCVIIRPPQAFSARWSRRCGRVEGPTTASNATC